MFSSLVNVTTIDNNKDSDNIEYNKECENIVKIETIGDGSCFIHSILKCAHEEYIQKRLIGERKEIAYEFRKSLIDILKEPNPNFPTLESVVALVKLNFFGNKKGLNKEEKGIKTVNFFRVCYGFEYLPHPVQMKPYTIEYFSSIKEYYDYVVRYRNYLLNFDSYLDRKISTIPKFESLKSNNYNVELKPLNKELLEYVDSMIKVQENISKRVNELTYDLRKV